MKKFLAILLAQLMCICFLPVFASAADEDIIASIEGGTAQIGGTITVPVSLTVNRGFVTLGIEVSYDANVLEIECPKHKEGKNCFPSVEKVLFKGSNAGANSQYHTDNPYRIQWAYSIVPDDVFETGKIAAITFRVKSTATLGQTKVSVNIDQASRKDKTKPRPTFTGGDAVIQIVCAEHVSDAGTITKNPTCTEKGVKTYNCTICGDVVSTEEINSFGHSFGEWAKTKAPTCTEAGVETRICSNDANHTETKEIKASGHKLGNWQITKEPTLASEGKRTGKCSVCGTDVTETVPKLTTTIEGDKIDFTTDNKSDEKPKEEFKVDSTNKETFSGYVKCDIKETFPDANKPIIVENKTVAAIYNIVLRDTDNNAAISKDKVVVLTVPVRESILSSYKNIVLVSEQTNGKYVVIKDAKFTDGKFVVTGKYGTLSKLLVAGDKVLEGDISADTESSKPSDADDKSNQQQSNSSSENNGASAKKINTTVLTLAIIVVLAAAVILVFISMRKRF